MPEAQALSTLKPEVDSFIQGVIGDLANGTIDLQ